MGVSKHIAYQTSDSPIGSWKYESNIMPLQNTGSFTNHCGLIDYKGNSYFFYHTAKLPEGGGFARSVAIEQFSYNKDNTFPIINATEKGITPVGKLDPYKRVEAETIAFSKGVKSEPNQKTGIYVSDIHNDDYILVREVDFTNKSPKKIDVTVASALRGGVIEVRIDSIKGLLLSEIKVPGTGGWENWLTLSNSVNNSARGVHDLYFVFKGRKGCKLFNFDYWQFYK